MANVFTSAIKTDLDAQRRVKRWIRDLKSGKYAQAQGRLKATWGGYCCLGVACNVVKPDEWASADYNDPKHIPGLWHPLAAEEGAYLGPKGRKLYHLTYAGMQALAKLNDEGASFKDIAKRLSADLKAKVA